MENEDFYVYGHFDQHGRCRYVGKGRLNRAWTRLQRSKIWLELFGESRFLKVEIFEKYLKEEEAYKLEFHHIQRMIKAGAPLVNVILDGGRNFGEYSHADQMRLAALRSGEKHWTYGIPRPQETRDKIAKTKQDNPDTAVARYWRGRSRKEEDPETIRKMQALAHTPEAIEKRRQKMIGRTLSEEHKQKISEGGLGRINSEETKQKISAAKRGRPNGLLGRKMSEEQKLKISETRIKRKIKLSPESQAKRIATWMANGGTRSNAKAVICINTGVTYRCAKDAAAAVGGSDKHIQACCVGRRQRHMKMEWKYV
jgi:hypothetical protein